MSDSAQKAVRVATGVMLQLLFSALLILQLTGKIDIAWYWIAAPLWAPPILIVTIMAVAVLVGALALKIRGPSLRQLKRDK